MGFGIDVVIPAGIECGAAFLCEKKGRAQPVMGGSKAVAVRATGAVAV